MLYVVRNIAKTFLVSLLMINSTIFFNTLYRIIDVINSIIYVSITPSVIVKKLIFKFLWLVNSIGLVRKFYVCINRRQPAATSFIVISNHVNDYDWLYITKTIDSQYSTNNNFFYVKSELLDIPVLGYVLKKMDFIPVYRSKKRYGDQKLNFIQQHHIDFSIILFPEGGVTHSRGVIERNFLACKKNITHEGQIFKTNDVMIPHFRGFGELFLKFYEHTNILDFTILPNPYRQYHCGTQIHKDFWITEKCCSDFIVVVDLFETLSIKDPKTFLNSSFRKKDKIFKRYKELKILKKINNIFDFKKAMEVIGFNECEYKFTEINFSY